MEPQGKLNDADWPAGREKGFPGGPVFAVCGQICGQEAFDRIKAPEFVLKMRAFSR